MSTRQGGAEYYCVRHFVADLFIQLGVDLSITPLWVVDGTHLVKGNAIRIHVLPLFHLSNLPPIGHLCWAE